MERARIRCPRPRRRLRRPPIVDARMAELAALRAELADRVGTGCPLRAAGV
ncbi:hypothetical protein [Streptomyces sp. NPDC058291]|uniref:hypothetical protein n=1 Tax=Streptomyces sp. NPDC058291 TaxID=3346427 RepID=UPI0036E25C64